MKNLLTIEHKNVHGELMTLVLTNDYEQLFKHNDCNDDFEKLSELDITIKLTHTLQKTKKKSIESFKYILDEEERAVLIAFGKLATIITEADKKFNKPVENTLV